MELTVPVVPGVALGPFAPPVPMGLVQLTSLKDYPRKRVVSFVVEALNPSVK